MSTVFDMTEEEFARDPLQRALAALDATMQAAGMEKESAYLFSTLFQTVWEQVATEEEMRQAYQWMRANLNEQEVRERARRFEAEFMIRPHRQLKGKRP